MKQANACFEASLFLLMHQPISEDIIIRLAKPEDSEIIVDIQYNAIRIISAKDYNYRQLNALLRSKSFQRKSKEIIFVAEINHQVVGFASLIYPFNTVGGIFVSPAFARKGVGTKLLQRLEQEVIANNIPILWVSSSLTGYPFYQANGYRTIVRTNFPLYSTYIPVVQMKKRLLSVTRKEIFREVYQFFAVIAMTTIITFLFL
ncbi:GNAT family N-acetyltransferase [Pleurocapsa sp. PCC 7319]|uniref:GNAT family N-acetyltransferase n=1 Tax=Pleurocapsa sp. PCC 7319 TaxID=118161 RepID=UPI0003499844|nr:GNAT family N-acetyltransferase [Pleurocapsa sp. PCC 7319]